MATLNTLVRWLDGEFENPDQALAQPAWFVRLRLWQRQLVQGLNDRAAIFAEQANVLKLDTPYRQRIFTLTSQANGIAVQYYAFKDPARWRGAGAQPERLAAIAPADLDRLPGCQLLGLWQGDRLRAQPVPGSQCFFEYAGAKRQVELGFEVNCDRFWSYDRGVDPETGKGLWGALMGPYEFTRVP